MAEWVNRLTADQRVSGLNPTHEGRLAPLPLTHTQKGYLATASEGYRDDLRAFA